MAVRKVIKIDEEKCTGCGKCVMPCAEGAIEIVGGKAKVIRDELCDGAGYCLGICPTGALTLEEREAAPFNAAAAHARQKEREAASDPAAIKCYRCGAGDHDRVLFPVRVEGRSEWVCAKCIPTLIHG